MLTFTGAQFESTWIHRGKLFLLSSRSPDLSALYLIKILWIGLSGVAATDKIYLLLSEAMESHIVEDSTRCAFTTERTSDLVGLSDDTGTMRRSARPNK
jgi:hypothetical protein